MPRLSRARIDGPGITRVRRGSGFSYLDSRGGRVTSRGERERIAALAVPPAWSDVWIAPSPTAHILATGVDDAGRTQYIYHPAWRERVDKEKFDRMLALARRLPGARRAVSRDLTSESLTKTRVLAGAFRLLDVGSVRPGADQYTDQHGSYGITTLLGSHATVHGRGVTELRFPGKSGHKWHLEIDDPALARLVGELKRRGPRARLFAWRDDDGGWHSVSPQDINAYVRERTGGEFTAKDFRTLSGTAAAAESLARQGAFKDERAQRRAIAEAMRAAADALGNTPAIAKASYVDPRVVELYAKGKTIDSASRRTVEAQLLGLLS